jgi:hypothetical protein
VHIFNPEKGISSTTSARIQRYATFLPGYDYEIVFRKTEQHANADVLSRLPLQNSEKEVDNEETIHVFHVEVFKGNFVFVNLLRFGNFLI